MKWRIGAAAGIESGESSVASIGGNQCTYLASVASQWQLRQKYSMAANKWLNR